MTSTVAGHPIIVTVAAVFSIFGSLSVSDTVNSYSSGTIRSQIANAVQTFYTLSGVGGSLTITASAATGTLNHIYCTAREYAVTTSLSFQGEAGFTNSSTASPTSNALNTTGNALLIGGLTEFNVTSGGITGAWGDEGKNTDGSNMVAESEDQLNVAPSSYQAQFTIATAQSDWAANITAFSIN